MIRVRNIETLQVEITNDRHKIHSDVSVKQGGNDTALNPHELMEASLGACTNMTLMMYARLKKMPLTDVRTTVQIEKEGGENIISRKIELIGELTEDEREKLMKIADKCPMHNFLVNKTTINTEQI